MENLPKPRDTFYAAQLPKTLSECVVRAAECDQNVTAELALLRGLLDNLLKDIKDSDAKYGREERAEIREFTRDIRATLKVQSELSAREKGLLHPSALMMCAQMVVNIIHEVLPDPEQCSKVQIKVRNRMAQLPLKELEGK